MTLCQTPKECHVLFEWPLRHVKHLTDAPEITMLSDLINASVFDFLCATIKKSVIKREWKQGESTNVVFFFKSTRDNTVRCFFVFSFEIKPVFSKRGIDNKTGVLKVFFSFQCFSSQSQFEQNTIKDIHSTHEREREIKNVLENLFLQSGKRWTLSTMFLRKIINEN